MNRRSTSSHRWVFEWGDGRWGEGLLRVTGAYLKGMRKAQTDYGCAPFTSLTHSLTPSLTHSPTHSQVSSIKAANDHLNDRHVMDEEEIRRLQGMLVEEGKVLASSQEEQVSV